MLPGLDKTYSMAVLYIALIMLAMCAFVYLVQQP